MCPFLYAVPSMSSVNQSVTHSSVQSSARPGMQSHSQPRNYASAVDLTIAHAFILPVLHPS
eukprot:10815572-Lingulodinium_polyedra.AAC.1